MARYTEVYDEVFANLKGYAMDYEEALYVIDEDVLVEYAIIVTKKIMADPEFASFVEEEGPMSGWEANWIRDFINKHSGDFYTLFNRY